MSSDYTKEDIKAMKEWLKDCDQDIKGYDDKTIVRLVLLNYDGGVSQCLKDYKGKK